MSIDFDKNVDYYKILEIPRNSNREAIKAGYRNILRNLKAHPDLGGDHDFAVKINMAYKVLYDSITRRNYDTARNELLQHEDNSEKRVICTKCGSQNIIVGEITVRNVCGKCGEHFIENKGGAVQALSPSPDIQIDANTTKILNDKSEVIISFTGDEKVRTCLRCGKSWEKEDIKGKHDERCPACKSHKWSQFRLFKCRFCDKKFITVDLYHWAYKIYPACPYCRKKAWNAGSEKNPLKCLLSKLSGV